MKRRVAPALRESPLCDLVAITRARADLADEARALGAARWHSRWQDLVADPDIECVYVATPVFLHAEQTIAAAEAGKHVLCEKPMAIAAADCDRMIAACQSNGVKLGIAYYRRFYPAIVRLKAIVESGEIGRAVVAQLNAFERFDPAPDHPRRWLLDPAVAGGGPMMDFGCHRLEMLLNLFGPVRRTASLTANMLFVRDVEDTAAVLLAFEHGPCASVTVTHAACEPQDTVHVFGSSGSVHIDVLNSGTMRIRTADGERIEHHPPAANVHQPLVDDFAEAVLQDREPAVGGETGRAVTAIEDEIYAVAPARR